MSGEQERIDRLTYDAYTLAETERFLDAGNLFWFDANKATRIQARRRSTAPEDFCAGPWWALKPWLTQEAIDWVEVAGNTRYTFTDWQRIERERRATAAEFDAEQSDPLRTLEYARELHDKRGELIAEARENGAPWADIMAATGLSRMAAYTLAKDYTHPAAVVPPTMPEWERFGYASAAEMADAETPF